MEFYSSYATGPLRCVGRLQPSSVTASSVYSADRNGPDEAIDGLVRWGNGWRSANFSGPEAWLQVSFVSERTVQCVRLYQESSDSDGVDHEI